MYFVHGFFLIFQLIYKPKRNTNYFNLFDRNMDEFILTMK